MKKILLIISISIFIVVSSAMAVNVVVYLAGSAHVSPPAATEYISLGAGDTITLNATDKITLN